MLNDAIENEKLRKSLLFLSNMQRMVILLNVILRFDLNETAMLIGSNVNSVKAHKSKAVKRLRKALEKE